MIKKLILLILMVLVCAPAWCANKFAVGSGAWSSATLWKTTSGGATATTAPTTADVAYLDANTGTVTIDATTNVCQQLNATNFTGTIDSSNTANILAVSTTLTFSATTTFGATAWTLKLGTGTSTATWNFGGVTFPWNIQITGTGVKTLSGDVIITGSTTMLAGMTINGFNWYANGGIQSDNTTNSRTMQGTTNLYVGGGLYSYIVKRTSPSKLVFQGDITVKGSTLGSSSVGIYDCIFEYVSGTISFDPDVVFMLNGTNTVSVGSNIIFERLEVNGTTTLTADLYVAKSLQVTGTVTMTWIGAYTVHVGYGGGTANIIMYNQGTHISTTTKISFEGTGVIFSPTALNGMAYEAVNPWQIDLEINTPGTATFYALGTKNQWGGGRTLTYIAGTLVTTGCVFATTTGGYNFNVDMLVPTFEITTAVTATLLDDFDCTTFRQVAGSTLAIKNDSVLTVGTNMYSDGTSLASSNIVGYEKVPSFVGGITVESADGILYPAIGTANPYSFKGTGAMSAPVSIGAGDNCTIAFTVKNPIPSTGSHTVINTPDRIYFSSGSLNNALIYFTDAAGHNCRTNSMSWSTTTPYRIVITKEAGVGCKIYRNGTLLANAFDNMAGYSFTFANLPVTSMNLSEFVIFSDVKDQTWVTADYNSGDMTRYDSASMNILYGWHLDSFTIPKITYNGTYANQKVNNTIISNVDASTTPIWLNDWNGVVSNSQNVRAVTGQDIGGGGLSVSIF